jgi:hypothetical protein
MKKTVYTWSAKSIRSDGYKVESYPSFARENPRDLTDDILLDEDYWSPEGTVWGSDNGCVATLGQALGQWLENPHDWFGEPLGPPVKRYTFHGYGADNMVELIITALTVK